MTLEGMIQNYQRILSEHKEQVRKEQEQLRLDDRKDEADHVRIKGNIYEIFETLFKTHVNQLTKSSLSEEEKIFTLKEQYLKRFETIPKSWISHLEQAREHNDVTNIVIEEIKLKAAEELKEQFLAITLS